MDPHSKHRLPWLVALSFVLLGVWLVEGQGMTAARAAQAPEGGVLKHGGPDPFGYTFVDSLEPGGPAYNWVEIGTSGTEITDGADHDDAFFGPFPIGFAFPFYGNSYSTFYVGSNGYLSFGQGYNQIPDDTLPNANPPNNDVMLFGDDLYVAGGVTHIYYQMLSNPTRLVIEFVSVDRASPRGILSTFEAILSANGNVLAQYAAVNTAYRPRVAGLENGNGTVGLSYGASTLAGSLAVQYYYPGQTPPDLGTSTKTASPSGAPPGGRISYAVVVRNTGGLAAAGTFVSDPIPDHTAYVAGSAGGGASYNAALDRIEWSGTVVGGGTVTPTFQVAVDADAPPFTHITNTATIAAPGIPAPVVVEVEICAGCGLAQSPQPMHRHGLSRSGRSPYHGPVASQVKWSYTTSNHIDSSPAIGPGGTIYFGSNDGYLYALRADGTLWWKYRTGSPNYSSPAIARDGTVYIGGGSYLYAVNADGSVYRWRYATGGTVYSSPAVGVDGTVYAGSTDGYLYALHPDGTLWWRYNVGGVQYSSPAVGWDGTVYIGSAGYLYAVKADGSGYHWRTSTGNCSYSTPTIAADGTVYIGSTDKYLYAVNPDGSLRWSRSMGYAIYSSPVVGDDGTVYVGVNDDLCAVKADGSGTWWCYDTGGEVRSSPVLDGNGTLYFGSYDTDLYALVAGPGGGTKRWQYNTGGILYWSSPAIGVDGTVYIGSYDNKLYAIAGTPPNFSTSAKVVSPQGGMPGERLTYTLVVANSGGLSAMSATLVDPVPAQTSYVAGSATGGLVYDGGTKKLTWSGVVTSGHTLTFTFQVDVADPVAPFTYITNDATLDDGLLPAPVHLQAAACIDCGLAQSPQPMHRHDRSRSGRSPYAGPVAPQLKWSYTTGNDVGSSPAIGPGGTLYFGSDDGYLYALRADGTLWWRYNTGSAIYSSPAIARDGTVYIGVSDDLCAVKPDGSGTRWCYDTGGSVYSSPAIGPDGTIYAGSVDDYLYALHPDGTLWWRYNVGDVQYSSPAVGWDGTVYIGSASYLYAVKADGSGYRWRTSTGNCSYSTPTIGADGTVYIGSTDKYLYAVNLDGSLRWSRSLSYAIYSSPVVGDDGTVYVGVNDDLCAVKADGSGTWWCYDTGGEVRSSPVLDANGTLYFGSYDSDLYALAAGPGGGMVRWQYNTGGSIYYSSPAIGADGTVYIGSYDNKLYAVGKTPPYLGASSKGVLGPKAAGGFPLTYTVGVYNSGELPAAGVVATDPIPANTSYVEGSATGGATYNSALNRIEWSGTVAYGQLASFGFQVQVLSGVPPGTAITNTVEIDHDSMAEPLVREARACVGCGLAEAPQPMFRGGVQHLGRSGYAGPAAPALSWSYATGDDIESSPAIGPDGTRYVGSTDGSLYAIHANGTLRWSYATGSPIYSSPAVGADGMVYVGAGTYLYAVKSTGTGYQWRYNTGGTVSSSPAVGLDGTVYAGSADDYLYALHPDGTLWWKYNVGDVQYSSPAVGGDGTVYIGSAGFLNAVRPDGGGFRWRYATGNSSYSSPAVDAEGVVYIGSANGWLYAVRADGTPKWSYPVGGGIYASPAVGVDGTVYVGSDDDRVVAVKPDGSLRWSYLASGNVRSSAVVGSDGSVVVGSEGGKVVALDASGSLRWGFSAAAIGYSSPAIGADGTVSVGARDGKLYTITAFVAPVLAAIGNSDGDGSYLVDWSTVVGATGYTLQEDDNAGFSSPAVRYSGTESQVQVTGQPAGIWYYRVKATNAGGDSAWSNIQSVSVVPAAPVLAAIGNGDGDGDYLVDWSDVTGAAGYTLQEDDNAGFSSPVVRYAGADSQYDVTGQAAGTWYYRVRASNVGGDSPWSNTQSVVVGQPPLPAPVLAVIGNADGDGSYLVDWSDVTGATGYILQEDDNPGFFSPVVRYSGPNSQYQVGGQGAGTWYYRVRASGAGGSGPWSNTQSAGVAPAAPVLQPIGNADGNGDYLVDWNDVTGATGYTLQEDDNAGFSSPTVRYTGANTDYQVTGQVAGTWYYRVRASNAGGDSAWSATQSASVIPAAPVLAAIGNSDGDGSYLVDWNDVAGATGYTLQEDDNAGFSSPAVRYTGTNSQYQVTGQAAGIWYYRVRASNVGGDSPWSNTQSVGVAPAAPVLAAIDNANGNGSYLVDWSAVAGATGYTLQEDDNAGFSSPTVRYTGANTDYQVTGQPGGTWYYRVRAGGPGGDGPWSNTQPASVIPAVPVLAVIGNADGDGSYLVDWNDVTGATGYTLQEDDNAGFSSPAVRYTGANSQYQVTGQAAGLWYYRVRASNAGGNSAWSNVQSVSVALAAPVLVEIDNADGDGSYLVDWSTVAGATAYTLQEDDNAGFSSPAVRYTGADSQVQVTGQGTGTWYYRVHASNAWGDGLWSNTRSVRVGPPSPLYMPLVMRSWFPDPYEPNDSFFQAWGPLVSGATYRAYFPRVEDTDDYYYVDMPATHSVEIWLTGIAPGNNYDLILYNSAHVQIDQSLTPGEGDEHIWQESLPAGKYYIRLRRVAGTSTTQPYALTVVFQ